MYDTVIVGGGLAGLTVTLELALRMQRGESVCLLEREPTVGGRALTYQEHGLQYEIGAGRIYKDHARVNELVKRYKLKTFPITSESHYDAEPNPFLDMMVPILRILEALPPNELGNTTLAKLIPEPFSPLFSMYPYTSELHVLRADKALEAFRKEMGATGKEDYYGIAEGIQTLAHRLEHDARNRNAVIKTGYNVTDVKRIRDELFEVTGTSSGIQEVIQAKRIVFATDIDALRKFAILKGSPFLQQIRSAPLLRIYAVYPPNKDGTVWFTGKPKRITNGKLRFVIPINPEKGLIMISYTDGHDAEYWRNLEGSELQATLAEEVAKEFPEDTIPEPTYLKKHFWNSGCAYWTPGDYDVEKASMNAHNPSKNVYVCGESVSLNQAWLEGALESAEKLLRLL
jgi:glycine/D-amino acid oxidase-like deaminating enzyme